MSAITGNTKGAEDPVLQWVTFRLENRNLRYQRDASTRSAALQEIALCAWSAIPVLGIINLRGNVVSHRYGCVFGLSTADTTGSDPHRDYRGGKSGCGYLVDAVAGSGVSASVGNRDHA